MILTTRCRDRKYESKGYKYVVRHQIAELENQVEYWNKDFILDFIVKNPHFKTDF